MGFDSEYFDTVISLELSPQHMHLLFINNFKFTFCEKVPLYLFKEKKSDFHGLLFPLEIHVEIMSCEV